MWIVKVVMIYILARLSSLNETDAIIGSSNPWRSNLEIVQRQRREYGLHEGLVCVSTVVDDASQGLSCRSTQCFCLHQPISAEASPFGNHHSGDCVPLTYDTDLMLWWCLWWWSWVVVMGGVVMGGGEVFRNTSHINYRQRCATATSVTNVTIKLCTYVLVDQYDSDRCLGHPNWSAPPGVDTSHWTMVGYKDALLSSGEEGFNGFCPHLMRQDRLLVW